MSWDWCWWYAYSWVKKKTKLNFKELQSEELLFKGSGKLWPDLSYVTCLEFPHKLDQTGIWGFYLCGIIFENLSCTCWMHTFVKWVKTREAVALLTAKLRLFLSQTISCLRSALFSPLEAKQRGSVPGKQVNHVKFLKVQSEKKKKPKGTAQTPKLKKK